VEDKSCRRWLRRDRYNGVAGAFAAIYFAVLPSVLRSHALTLDAGDVEVFSPMRARFDINAQSAALLFTVPATSVYPKK
jgi:hypothetical protein